MMAPATNPPMVGFQLSSTSLKFAAALRTNMYEPPIAATNSYYPSLFPSKLGQIARTEDSNCASGASKYTHGTNVLLGKRVLDGAEQCANTTHDQGSFDTMANCISPFETFRFGGH